MSSLYLIPARAGSKGIPDKNYKPLAGKPLFLYSLETALQLAPPADICLSTDDEQVIELAKKSGYQVPFTRPPQLSTDEAGSYEVMLHALDFYENKGIHYDTLILLQPTSPLRKPEHVKEALDQYTPGVDMVVSVKKTKSNPYYILMEENENGWLEKSKTSSATRRQDVPDVYELNGAIYIINTDSLKQNPPSKFKYVRKYVMDEISSVDIDTSLDWIIAETILNQKKSTSL